MINLKYTLLACIMSLFIFSCNKDADKKNEVLKITPEKIVSYAGKDWGSISSEFKTKKDYWYTELNSGNVLAAVSLTAKDEGPPASNYKLLFNVNQQNRVTNVVLYATDSMDVATGNKLFLYYYEKTLSQMDGVIYTSAIDDFTNQVNIGVEKLLAELHTFNCAQASLSYQNNTMNMNARFIDGFFSFYISTP